MQIELRCNVCDSVLYIVTESKSDKDGTYFYVERCDKCYASLEKLQELQKAVIQYADADTPQKDITLFRKILKLAGYPTAWARDGLKG